MDEYALLGGRPLWYVLKDGVPVAEYDTAAAGRFFNDTKARIVQQDYFPDPRGEDHDDILISTVFLALDHNHRLSGPPVLWETMIFWEGSDLDDYQRRYTSLDAARRGHSKALSLVMAALKMVESDA